MSRLLCAALAAALVLSVLAAPADAQRRRRGGGDDAIARRGDAALTFSSEFLGDAPFLGGVGGRFWFTDRVVGAATLGFGYTHLDADYGDEDAFTTAFSVGVERHFGHRRTVSPFVGFTANVAHAEADHDEYYYPYPDCPPDVYCTQDAYAAAYSVGAQQTSVGGAALLGAEIRLASGVSLSLAHALGVTYVRSSSDYPPIYYPEGPPGCTTCAVAAPSDYDDAQGRVTVGTGTTALTLSVYF